jgi:hypothetical protein
VTGLGLAEQAVADEREVIEDDPDYVPNPPYDPPVGQSWNEWMDR